MIDTYSLLVAVLLFNVAMIDVVVLRRRTGCLTIYRTHALVLLALLNAVCITMPFKFHYAYFVRSYDILPAIGNALHKDRFQTAYSMFDAILLIWSAGSFVMLIKTAYSILKERNHRKRYRPADNARAVRIAREMQLRRAEIIVSPDVVVPCVSGLFRARIFLPDIDMTDRTLELILKHEYQHFKSRDNLIKTFYLLLSIVFWWNPIAPVFLRELDRLLETRCDASVVKRMGEKEKTSYMESLLYIAKHIQAVNTRTPVSISSFAQAGPNGFMEQRFRLIQSDKNTKPRIMHLVSIAVVVTVFSASLLIHVTPIHRVYPRPYTPMRQLTEEEVKQRGLPNNPIPIIIDVDTPALVRPGFTSSKFPDSFPVPESGELDKTP